MEGPRSSDAQSRGGDCSLPCRSGRGWGPRVPRRARGPFPRGDSEGYPPSGCRHWRGGGFRGVPHGVPGPDIGGGADWPRRRGHGPRRKSLPQLENPRGYSGMRPDSLRGGYHIPQQGTLSTTQKFRPLAEETRGPGARPHFRLFLSVSWENFSPSRSQGSQRSLPSVSVPFQNPGFLPWQSSRPASTRVCRGTALMEIFVGTVEDTREKTIRCPTRDRDA